MACLEKAASFERNTSQTKILSFRNLDLEPEEVAGIAQILKAEKSTHRTYLKSISFSYNHLIADQGTKLIIQSLPLSMTEIGLVACGIGDKGGRAVLNWMTTATQLQMICMEQNNFSDTLKAEINIFKQNNPQIMVVI